MSHVSLRKLEFFFFSLLFSVSIRKRVEKRTAEQTFVKYWILVYFFIFFIKLQLNFFFWGFLANRCMQHLCSVNKEKFFCIDVYLDWMFNLRRIDKVWFWCRLFSGIFLTEISEEERNFEEIQKVFVDISLKTEGFWKKVGLKIFRSFQWIHWNFKLKSFKIWYCVV